MKRALLFLAVALLVGGSVLYFSLFSKQEQQSADVSEEVRGACLGENEVVDYPVDEKYGLENRYPKLPLVVEVKDKISGEKKISFLISEVLATAHPLEIRPCHVYVAKSKNYDVINDKPLPGYEVNIVRYNYAGEEKIVFPLYKNERRLYGTLFTVDPLEKVISLERGYFGQSDYALVIKDLETKEDVFAITPDDIKRLNPEVELGSFDIGRWVDGGRYLWGVLFNGARDTAYYRIETGTWRAEIFAAPERVPSGVERASNPAGYLAYSDFTTFYGIDVVAQEVFERFRKEGRTKHLYLYNLRTEEKMLLATSTDPEFRFKPRWISGGELSYLIPSGEERRYKLPQ